MWEKILLLVSLHFVNEISGKIVNVHPIEGDRSINCPNGYMPLMCGCFTFVPLLTLYNDAKKNCENSGGKLAEPINKTQFNLITRVARSKANGQYYLGISRLDDSTEWSYTSNLVDTTQSNALCVTTHITTAERDCLNDKHYYVCELCPSEGRATMSVTVEPLLPDIPDPVTVAATTLATAATAEPDVFAFYVLAEDHSSKVKLGGVYLKCYSETSSTTPLEEAVTMTSDTDAEINGRAYFTTDWPDGTDVYCIGTLDGYYESRISFEKTNQLGHNMFLVLSTAFEVELHLYGGGAISPVEVKLQDATGSFSLTDTTDEQGIAKFDLSSLTDGTVLTLEFTHSIATHMSGFSVQYEYNKNIGNVQMNVPHLRRDSIIVNWNSVPSDVSVYLTQFDPSTNAESCTVEPRVTRDNQCGAHKYFVNTVTTGLDGGDVIQIDGASMVTGATYMIWVSSDVEFPGLGHANVRFTLNTKLPVGTAGRIGTIKPYRTEFDESSRIKYMVLGCFTYPGTSDDIFSNFVERMVGVDNEPKNNFALCNP